MSEMAGKIKVADYCSNKTYSVCESDSSRVEEDGESDGPAVFMCGKCKIPVGDSLSWAGSDDQQNQIMLKRISDNAVIGKEPFVSGTRKELGCYVVRISRPAGARIRQRRQTSDPGVPGYCGTAVDRVPV
ncbi:protein Mis18-alpha isoform X2 [Carassius gibelio]|uniref:protein Mis18-alpha isoform X2 n=1 Tax=Carassius gibelio TaxID=101364 RepID=UPI002277D115|nr:protein Mis18-alpha isoform X2 [Carassius gibelio]